MTVIKKEQSMVDPTPWGQLTWFASSALENSDKITLGECRINVGHENPRHHHPNCDEVLHVLSGKIIHTFGNDEIEMNVGDTITVPQGVIHNARNIGNTQAVMTIVFTDATRNTIGE